MGRLLVSIDWELEKFVSSIPVKALKAGSTQILLEGADESPYTMCCFMIVKQPLAKVKFYEALILEIFDHAEGESVRFKENTVRNPMPIAATSYLRFRDRILRFKACKSEII